MGKVIPREERIARLKLKIAKHKARGGSIYDSKASLDYYSDLITIIKLDRKEGKESNIESIYAECGEIYVAKKVSLITIEDIKKKIDAYIDQGGSIYDKKEDLPYYVNIVDYIKREKRKNNILSVSDIYRLCGYEYISKKTNEIDLLFKFNEYKDENGFIDSIKYNEKGMSYYESALYRAKELNMDVNTYLICFYGVRLNDRFINVDYVEMVEKELEEFAKKHNGHVNSCYIRIHDETLFNKIAHLGKYFPLGSITTSGVIRFFGYDVNTEKKEIGEKLLLKKLEELYPDRKIESIHDEIYNKVIFAAAYYDLTVEKYLDLRGYKYLVEPYRNKNHFRLSKTKMIRDDETYEILCNYRKQLINDSKVLNDDNYSDKVKSNELKKIALKVYEKSKSLNEVR